MVPPVVGGAGVKKITPDRSRRQPGQYHSVQVILSCVKLTVKTIQPTSITQCPPVKVMNNCIYSLFWSVKELPLKLMDARQGARLSVKDEQGLLVSSHSALFKLVYSWYS